MSVKKAMFLAGVVLAVATAIVLTGCKKNPVVPQTDDGTVTINDLRWSNKNIDIDIEGSRCYRNRDSICAIYGRLYTWEAANNVCESMGDGWRLPNNEDWDNLMTAAGGGIREVDKYGAAIYKNAGIKLKSKTGWQYNVTINTSGNGTDDFGFSALPGGWSFPDGDHFGAGNACGFWSATEETERSGGANAYYRRMQSEWDDVQEHNTEKKLSFSVRCVQDVP